MQHSGQRHPKKQRREGHADGSALRQRRRQQRCRQPACRRMPSHGRQPRRRCVQTRRRATSTCSGRARVGCSGGVGRCRRCVARRRRSPESGALRSSARRICAGGVLQLGLVRGSGDCFIERHAIIQGGCSELKSRDEPSKAVFPLARLGKKTRPL